MSNILESKFKLGKEKQGFILINQNSNISIFVGYIDKNPTMVISGKGNPKNVDSSKYISVKLFKKSVNEIRIAFTLLDLNMYNIFLKFCSDVIERTNDINKDYNLEFIIRLWNDWRLVFKKASNNLLSENEIVGLLGELIFLKEYAIPNWGEKIAIESWMGPEKLHKDFELEKTWYEIKVTKSSSLTVKISSLEQLESNIEGHLVIINLDKTSPTNLNKININKYIQYIKDEINDFNIKLRFLDKLNHIGYYMDEEYDKYNYKLNLKKLYRVTNSFPKIRREDLRDGIVKLSYEILISSIEEYLEEGI